MSSVHVSARLIMSGLLTNVAMEDTQWAPDKDYSRDAMVQDIAAIVRELVLPLFILIGMSMGGAHAMTYTSRYPTTVKALVLVDVGPEIKQEGVDNIRRLVGLQEWPSLDAAVTDIHRFNTRRSRDNIRQRLSHSLRQLPSGAWTWKVMRSSATPIVRAHGTLPACGRPCGVCHAPRCSSTALRVLFWPPTPPSVWWLPCPTVTSLLCQGLAIR